MLAYDTILAALLSKCKSSRSPYWTALPFALENIFLSTSGVGATVHAIL